VIGSQLRKSRKGIVWFGWLLLFAADSIVTFVADWLFKTPPQGFEYVRQMDFQTFITDYWLAFVIMFVWLVVCVWIAIPHKTGKWRAGRRERKARRSSRY